MRSRKNTIARAILPMSEINDAIRKLHEESPAHRIVLRNDFD